MFQTKLVEEIKTHVLCSITVFENCIVYEIVWKNMADPERPPKTKGRMRVLCCIPKTTNTHSEYVILTALPLQQRLQGSALKLRYTYIASLVQVWFLNDLFLIIIKGHDRIDSGYFFIFRNSRVSKLSQRLAVVPVISSHITLVNPEQCRNRSPYRSQKVRIL
jgi:hypothetical protein